MSRFLQNKYFDKSGHIPVLLNEAIEYLNLHSDSRVIDATLDGGGHTLEILNRFPEARVLGIEWDPVEFKEIESRILNLESRNRLTAVNDSYVNMREIAAVNDFRPDAILFDLGVSSWHYESSGRGFSFQKNEPLDMRFNPDKQIRTAADVVNLESKEELVRLLMLYGEERFSVEIANAVVQARRNQLLATTDQLTHVIGSAVPEWYKHRKIHYATKTFQALRMAVNDELVVIQSGLEAGIDVLLPGGRLAVISFHGLEDKTVRRVFKDRVTAGVVRWVTKNTIKPKWAEVKENSRARSAKMKIVEKI